MGVFAGITTSYLLETPNVSPAVQKYVSWAKAQEGDTGRTPALDLNFAENKSLVDDVSGSNLITFTRTSAATYVGLDGLIKTTPVNLLTRSEEFDSTSWAKSNSTVNANTASAPSGETTADTLIENTATSVHAISKSVSASSSTTYTFTVHAKANERSHIDLVVFGVVTTTCIVRFTLSGSGTSAIRQGSPTPTHSITALSGGWYRCQLTFTTTSAGSATSLVQLAPDASSSAFYTGDGVSGVYLWGAQLEEGTTATDYIPTTSTISGAPRFDHDPDTGESLGLLIEESRTNLILYSNDFSQSNWIKQNSHPTPSKNAIGPDGVANSASTVYRTATNQYLYQSISGGGTYTLSAWVKSEAATGDFRMNAYNGIDGTMAESFTATNEWQRFETTISPTTNTNYYPCIPTNTNTNFYVWGVQVESGSFKTSYIPTSSSTVTRSPDLTSITGSNLTSWYNVSEGTLYVDFKGEVPGGATGGYFGSNVYGWGVYSNASNIANKGRSDFSPDRGSYNISNNQVSLYRGAISQSDIVGKTSYAVNGTLYATDADRLGPYITPSGFSVSAADVGSASQTRGSFTVKRTMYWGLKLSNSTLQSLTQ